MQKVVGSSPIIRFFFSSSFSVALPAGAATVHSFLGTETPPARGASVCPQGHPRQRRRRIPAAWQRWTPPTFEESVMDADKVSHLERVARYECAMCRAPVTMTEKSGLGYCDAHWRVVHPQRLRRLFGAGGPARRPEQRQARHRRGRVARIGRSFTTRTDND
jgi:hypothetical protein